MIYSLTLSIDERTSSPPSTHTDISANPNTPTLDLAQQAQPINAFVVPVPDGVVTFFDIDYPKLQPQNSAFRVDVYSPFDLSAGETEYVRAEIEADIVAYAKRKTARETRWLMALFLGLVDFVILALLVAFIFINSDASFLIFFWVFGVVLLAGPFAAIRALSQRQVFRRATALLESPIEGAFAGRAGGETAGVRDIWEGLSQSGNRRDLATLEGLCRTAGWRAGVRFYRQLRQGASGPDEPQSILQRLVGLFTTRDESIPLRYIPCRTS